VGSSSQLASLPIALIRQGLRTLGEVTIQVSGVSMLPTLPAGEQVVLRRADRERLQPGAVVAFRSRDGILVLHRVRGVTPNALLTAGDNQVLLDPPVPVSDVVGVVDDLPGPPPPPRWTPEPAGGPVHAWLMTHPTFDDHATAPAAVPDGWRVHRRPAEGIGVSAAVLEELRSAVDGVPTVALTHQAVHAAADVLTGPLPPGTQVLVGFPLGRLPQPMPPGHLVPAEFADVHVRIGPPGLPLRPAEALARLVTLTGGPA
jgi:hypothetical protein